MDKVTLPDMQAFPDQRIEKYDSSSVVVITEHMCQARGYDPPVKDCLSNCPLGRVWRGVRGDLNPGPVGLSSPLLTSKSAGTMFFKV